MQKKVLILDNYDSFTYILGSYFDAKNTQIIIEKNDKITLKQVEEGNFTHIVISPGPGNPEKEEDFGICKSVIKAFYKKIPILGVCLGHQGIASIFGAKIVHAKVPMHGKKDSAFHNETFLFSGIENPMQIMRYHSLIVDKKTLSPEFLITAQTKTGEIMGIKHKKYSLYGVQFHPESVGTKNGNKLIENFLNN